jgi:hypothetical protein
VEDEPMFGLSDSERKEKLGAFGKGRREFSER